MSFITTLDGAEIFYKDWGQGPAVVFSHGWPLNSDAWDEQMLFLAQNGFRTVAHVARRVARLDLPEDLNYLLRAPSRPLHGCPSPDHPHAT